MHNNMFALQKKSRLSGVILAALLAGSTGAGQAATVKQSTELPTTVYVNAQVFTAEEFNPYAEAVAVRGDKILAVGRQSEVLKAAGNSAHKVNLHGKFLMPGMIDAHAHPVLGGLTLVMANFLQTETSIPELIKFIDAQLDAHTSFLGDTLQIFNLDLTYWSHAAELDAILSHDRYASIPIVLNGYDGHTGWANEAARVRAGVTADFIGKQSPEKQKFFGFLDGFVPNGFVVDFGKNMIDESLPKPSPELMLAAGTAAVKYMNSVGVTGWLDAAVVGDASGAALVPGDAGVLPIYREMAARDLLTAHVAAYPVVSPNAGLEQINTVMALRRQFADVPNLTVAGLKIFVDGVVEYPSQTAAMLQAYRHTDQTVTPLATPLAMNAMVKEADRRGLLVHVHAIGDAAVRQALDAFEIARRANPKGKLKHAITHVQFVDQADQDRFAEYHVIAALQLLWALGDASTIELVQPYIDPNAYLTMYAARSLLDKGAEIAGASDWPVSSAAPLEAIYQAETRVGPEGVLFAEQSMPRLAMLYAYTRNAADALNQLQSIGTLAKGKRADMVLVDRDVLTVSADSLKQAKVIATMFAGKEVFGEGF